MGDMHLADVCNCCRNKQRDREREREIDLLHLTELHYLVDVDKERLEDDHVEVLVGEAVADVPQFGHHFLLHVRVHDVVALH